MSKQAALQFRGAVVESDELQDQIRAGFESGDFSLSRLAGENGYEFTPEEGRQVWDEFQESERELSDFELEMVAGGQSTGDCNNTV